MFSFFGLKFLPLSFTGMLLATAHTSSAEEPSNVQSGEYPIKIYTSVEEVNKAFKVVAKDDDSYRDACVTLVRKDAEEISSLLTKAGLWNELQKHRSWFLLVENYNRTNAQNLVTGQPFIPGIKQSLENPYEWVAVYGSQSHLTKDTFKMLEKLAAYDITTQLYVCVSYSVVIKAQSVF